MTTLDERPGERTAAGSTGTLEVLDSSGDTKITWRSDDPVSVAVARAAFNEARNRGATVYAMDDAGAKGGRVSEFDPEAERLVAVPQLQGG